jgi:hypothetical protein
MQSFLKKLFMEIIIEAGKTFGKVQEEFTQTFPYLKIDLVSTNILSKELYLTKENGDSKENGYNKVDDNNSFIILTDNITVKELVYEFKELFNLSVKVQRKSDGHWVETILTENWTLTKQNLEGKNLANFDFRKLKGD